MDQSEFPTKGNLLRTEHTLSLARQGYDLLEQKRVVLNREAVNIKGRAARQRALMERILMDAKTALIHANIEMGPSNVDIAAQSVMPENSVKVHTRNVMGVEIPLLDFEYTSVTEPPYRLADTSIALDEAYALFNEIKKVIVELAALENTVKRLEDAISKTQKRANALQHIIIPKHEARLKFMLDALEERERDGFVRLKVGKKGSEIKGSGINE